MDKFTHNLLLRIVKGIEVTTIKFIELFSNHMQMNAFGRVVVCV